MTFSTLRIWAFFALFCSFSSFLSGQHSFSDSLRTALSKNEGRRWNLFYREVSFPVGSILLNPNYGSGSIGFRKRIERGRMIRLKQTMAFRANLELNVSARVAPTDAEKQFEQDSLRYFEYFINSYYGYYVNDLDRHSSSFGQLSLGKEWQNNLDRFQFFFGADCFFDFQNQVYRGYWTRNNNDPADDVRSKIIGLVVKTGGTGFVGVRFFLHPRISLSTEAGFSLGVARRSDTAKNAEKGQKLETYVKTASYFLQSNTSARRFFSLNFHF